MSCQVSLLPVVASAAPAAARQPKATFTVMGAAPLAATMLSYLSNDPCSVSAAHIAFSRRNRQTGQMQSDVTPTVQLLSKLYAGTFTYKEFQEFFAVHQDRIQSKESIKLNLNGLTELQDVELEFLLSRLDKQNMRCARFPNASGLNLSKCSNITDEGLESLQYAPHLKTLSLRECPQITAAGLAHLRLTPELESIDLSGCPNITDAVLLSLVGTCRKLKRVILHGCANITDNAIVVLANNLPHLEELDVSNTPLTNQALLSLHGKESLIKLDLSNCGNGITQEGLAPLGSLRQLKELNLAGLDVRSLDALSRSWPLLEDLNVRDCSRIDGFACLLRLPNLKKLVASGCSSLGKDIAILAPVWAQRMQHLEMACCRLSDKGCERLSWLKKLRFLDISRNMMASSNSWGGVSTNTYYTVTDNILSTLSQCPSLEVLKAYETVITTSEIEKALPQLREYWSAKYSCTVFNRKPSVDSKESLVRPAKPSVTSAASLPAPASVARAAAAPLLPMAPRPREVQKGPCGLSKTQIAVSVLTAVIGAIGWFWTTQR